MDKIYFATNNEGKIKEAKELLEIEIEGCGLSIDEIQSLNEEEVAIKKAMAYYNELKKPILVEDVSLAFEALNGLPGTYINDFSKALGNEGLIALLDGKNSRRAVATTTLVFIDKNNAHHTFYGKVYGNITQEPRGENGFGWDSIFEPDGSNKTLAEMEQSEKNKHSMRAIAFTKLKDWFQSQN